MEVKFDFMVDVVVVLLCDMIINGELVVGEWFVECDLVECFGISWILMCEVI